MTIQLPKIEASESRLFQDNSKQNTDISFEQKLNYEKTRLGLLFSPFAQLQALFDSAMNFSFSSEKANNDLYRPAQLEPPKNGLENYAQNPAPTKTPLSFNAQIFESVPLQSFNRQFFQELLTKTNWLVPNLAASPLFAQAFGAGKLAPSFDLQALIDQLIEQAQLVKSKGQTELSLSLKPEELGEIFLTLTSRAGAVSIQIQASPETKKLIDSRQAELLSALKKNHVQISRLTIEEVKKNV